MDWFLTFFHQCQKFISRNIFPGASYWPNQPVMFWAVRALSERFFVRLACFLDLAFLFYAQQNIYTRTEIWQIYVCQTTWLFCNEWQHIIWSWLTMFADIDECAVITCLNGGTCLDLVANFSCLCELGYTGQLCETGKRRPTTLHI